MPPEGRREPAVKPRELLALAGALTVLTLVVFRSVLFTGQLLLTTDDNIGELASRKMGLPHGFLSWWSDSILVGLPGAINFTWTYILLWLFPETFVNNWLHGIDLAVASFFLVLFLRERRLGWPACAVAVLAAYWLGSNLTLTFAGHIGKFGVLLFAAAALWLSERAVQRRSVAWATLAGGAMGLMFLEQPDVGLFFALALGCYVLFALYREGLLGVRGVASVVAPVVVVAFLMAIRALWAGYTTNVEGVSVLEEDPRARWEFITQWSWPPEESIDFVAPGFTGWRSGEPEGPYWGRMGRSAGWSFPQGGGFENFKLENQYVGVATILLAVWAVCLLFVKADEHESKTRQDVRFWSILTLVTLLLSFGKYFPLYRLFYELPVVSSIRNPNKFLQVFQVALAVLAAYGLHDLLRRAAADAAPKALARKFLYGLGAAVLVFWICAAASIGHWKKDRSPPGSGRVPAMSKVMQENRANALRYSAIMFALAGGYIYLVGSKKLKVSLPVVPWLLVVLLGVDVLYLAPKYIRTMDARMLEENSVINAIQRDLGEGRLALLSQDSFYGQWLTYVFPYYKFSTVNVTQMPRMPDDYKAFLQAVGGNMLKQWQYFAVRMVLAPAQAWSQFQQRPELKEAFELKYAYNVVPQYGTAVPVPATQEQPGQHTVLGFTAGVPRYGLVSAWTAVSNEEALSRIGGNDYTPMETVLVPDTANLPPSPVPENGDAGNVTITAYRPGRVGLRVSAQQPAVLRVSEKYDPNWRATVNGETRPVFRTDYLFQGVYLEPGLHEVELKYAPPLTTLWFQIVATLVCLGALVRVVLEGRGGRDAVA